jgi:dimethylhistidine N-methyltransferase
VALDAAAGEVQSGADSLETGLLQGLLEADKSIDPKFFYDEVGSSLFADICKLPEYYPTRTETGILKENADAIAEAVGRGRALVEPGAGACEKIRHLLDALAPSDYLPIDISGDFLQDAVERLRAAYPGLTVRPITADFSAEFSLPELAAQSPPVLFYPGSTIGNFTPTAAASFLHRTSGILGPGSGLLIGYDLHKDSATLNAAYNDSQGLTARFNRNILVHVNKLLGADFNPGRFDHLAFYNTDEQRIEMHLVSQAKQSVRCRGKLIHFEPCERIHTEYSYKYSRESFREMAAVAGYTSRGHWSDPRDWFVVEYLEAA